GAGGAACAPVADQGGGKNPPANLRSARVFGSHSRSLGLTALLLAFSIMAASATEAATQGKGTMTNHRTETAVFAGGCFWCLEAIFEALKGAEHVTSGFSRGAVAHPPYEPVCT